MCANPKNLCVARAAVQRTAKLVGLNEEDAGAVTLAVEEALNNVIKHSYEGPCSKPMILKLQQLKPNESQPGGLEIIIQDLGRQVDPASIKGRDLDDVRPGGLGVHIISSLMDQMEYSIRPEGGMQLRMVKYLK